MFELWHRNFLEVLPVSDSQSPDQVFAVREHSG
jgi:hypothetical protein